VRLHDLGREDGFSLAELMVTIVIVGTVFAALLGGLMTSIRVSSQQQRQSIADAVARSAAEWVKDPVANPFQPCAVTGTYSLSGLSVPSGYSVTITGVENWNPSTTSFSAPYTLDSNFQPSQSGCSDHGLQRITIAIRSTDSRASETVQAIKRDLR
jgi:prepilin-type N-terminal cleavage/methylation domain-containing protein